jgi:murein DD-endopeptidase MepM/ murein hydrolase activator NlpD
MKKLLIFLLIILSIYLLISLYYLDKYYFLCPIAYERDFAIRADNKGSGFFGAKRKGRRHHQGIDLFAQIGTPVFASRFGIVIEATKNHGMGNYVKIRHFDNIITLYGHLSKIYVIRYQLVRQGQIIGLVGKTGNANHHQIQPHLHFEVRKKGIPQDPLRYLK